LSLIQKLLLWYNENKRSFLWRESQDPYKVWLSEIILQQTRTEQGLPYFKRFLNAYPRLGDLALASEDEVLKLWQGLGYYSRARNLHFTAKFIHNKLGGIFPNTFESLIELKGVGDYTASAIASICFGIPQAVVDGNVYRFLSRYFGIETPINSTSAHKIFKKKAMSLIGDSHPGTFNQAMMEFGSLHCTPKKPKCSTCPFSKNCVALNQNKISCLPVKTSRTKIKKRYFNYMVVSDHQDYYIFEKRLNKGIWQNLYQFPLLESTKVLKSEKKLVAHPNFPKKFNTISKTIKLLNSSPVIHKLSHQILEVNFWQIKTKMKLNNSVSKESIYKFPVPVVIDDFLKKFF
tara:strand:- start:854 stop:1894 length:1041 start_codon:yes stop_codon:yes gene_type:complete